MTLDIKQRIVQLRQEHLTLREIADRLKVSVGVVHKTLTIHEEDGEYTDPSKQRTGRPQILDDDDERYLRSLLESNPPIYLDEIKQSSKQSARFLSRLPRFIASFDCETSPGKHLLDQPRKRTRWFGHATR
jgi:transposase